MEKTRKLNLPLWRPPNHPAIALTMNRERSVLHLKCVVRKVIYWGSTGLIAATVIEPACFSFCSRFRTRPGLLDGG
jgi:hypothetical protein